MTKIIIPIASALEPGGALVELIANISHVYSAITKVPDSINLTIDDTAAPPEQKLVLDQDTILDILAVGGEIENYLFGIKAPLSSATIEVPEGVPLRTNITGSHVFDFEDWFRPGATVWKNSGSGEIMYYNNPNPSGSVPLKASESEIIRQINTLEYFFLTIAEVQSELLNPGWVQL